MTQSLTPNTQAIALLTAPLLVGQRGASSEALTPGEYKRLARFLYEHRVQPADLLAPDAGALLDAAGSVADPARLRRLMDRGFLLTQALERWQARSIWLISRADSAYPSRLKSRLRDDAPALLYGCGELALLEAGGLAVVGSRDVDAQLISYTEAVGSLAASAGIAVVSGGARGVDQAALRGVLEAGGQGIAVLADSLERAALHRDYREPLMQQRLVLVSPYDPAAGFYVGFAMQRNKAIYALADGALVVNSDLEKGGTWAGVVEQLDKLRLVPVYVRASASPNPGLEALRGRGALPWPNPTSAHELAALLSQEWNPPSASPRQGTLALGVYERPPDANGTQPGALAYDALRDRVSELAAYLATPRTAAEIAGALKLPVAELRDWLPRLVEEGILERLARPERYRTVRLQPPLFGAE